LREIERAGHIVSGGKRHGAHSAIERAGAVTPKSDACREKSGP
jgi:hypothetical protein